tara:strand:+ start:853 stop:1194 length:342 start_codon:yes stop_codon:yes gene_type:complete
MKKTLVLVALLLSATPAYSGQPEISAWDLSPDGAMVVTYRTITKDGVLEESFKHKIIVKGMRVSECDEVKVDGREMNLLTQEARPSVYIVETVPYERLKEVFLVRKPYLDWVR